jgi:CheY-like chemotaxis protein
MKGVLERVLYVEDDDDIRAVGTFAMEGVGGLTVRGCASGAEAVGCLATFAPQLILLDVMMPGMDGPATLASLRVHLGDAAVPVVFMTAKVQPKEVAEYRELGVVEVIAKPFDPMTLAAQIRVIYERAG